jgi:hypothetical protein
MSHYPFAHRGNVPFSNFPTNPMTGFSTLVYGVWETNIPDIAGFSKFEITPGDVGEFVDSSYPAAAATLSLQANLGPLHPGNVFYQYEDETLPDGDWEIGETNRVITVNAQIAPLGLRPRRRNTEFEMNVQVFVGITVSLLDTSDFPVVNFYVTGSSRTYQKVVSGPTPPTYLRRGRTVFNDYITTMNASDITFDSTPSGSSGGTIPALILARGNAYRDAIVSSIDGWEPVIKHRLFAMPYGVKQSITYAPFFAPGGIPKVHPGPLF